MKSWLLPLLGTTILLGGCGSADQARIEREQAPAEEPGLNVEDSDRWILVLEQSQSLYVKPGFNDLAQEWNRTIVDYPQHRFVVLGGETGPWRLVYGLTDSGRGFVKGTPLPARIVERWPEAFWQDLLRLR
jgi:hypothetical protein